MSRKNITIDDIKACLRQWEGQGAEREYIVIVKEKDIANVHTSLEGPESLAHVLATIFDRLVPDTPVPPAEKN